MFEKNVLNKNYETECVVQKVWNRMFEKNVFVECLLKVWKECVCGMFVKSLKRMCCTESLMQNVRKEEVLYRKFETECLKKRLLNVY